MITKLRTALSLLAAGLTLSAAASAGTIDVIGTLVQDGGGSAHPAMTTRATTYISFVFMIGYNLSGLPKVCP